LRASGGRIPELKRVIVAYQNQIVMEESLPAALNRIFGPGAARVTQAESGTGPAVPLVETTEPEPAGPVALEPGESLESLAALAQEHYQRAMQAQREGNWAQYGEEIQKLGEVLARMRGQPPEAIKP
jgi:uncharacterized membrane protein (UPF0182 family)